MSKEELLKYLIAEIDLIMHDKDYRFENQDGTWYSRESCRDLTNEEVLEELRTELRQFDDLEAKLAEKEGEIEDLKAQRRIYLNRSVEECNKITDLEFELQHKHQDKISFAVEQLEKVKENIKKVPIIDFDLSGNFEKMYKQDAIRQIDNQIKELKGEE